MKFWQHLILFLSFSPFCAIAQNTLNEYEDVAARIIIVGDGGVLKNGVHPVAQAISSYVGENSKNTTVLFLGDNIYQQGLPDEEENDHVEKKNVLLQQLQPFVDKKVSVYVIPGNHDWANGREIGWSNVIGQSRLVNTLSDNIKFLPQGGCPGPIEIGMGNDVVLVLMDTQWWLHENDKPDETSDCDCKTEAELVTQLKDIAFRNSNKKMLFAAHHPFKTYGIHGGYYTLKQHLFPVSDIVPNAYVPLPVLGSIYPIARGSFGNIQDVMHPVYKDMIKTIEAAMEDVVDLTYVAGHEHNLQLIKKGDRHYVVSGSGSKSTRVKMGKGSLFAASKIGFAEIVYTNSGKQIITFYEVDEKATKKTLFSYSVDKKHVKKQQEKIVAQEVKKLEDSVLVAIAPEYDEVSNTHRFLFGEHYRKLWATPVKLKVFDLKEEQGGLSILKRGGGQQTKSLRLEDSLGKQWVLRTVQKDPEKALPSNLRGTIAKSIVQDQISAANPYAPLVVPILANAINLPHANPQIMYVPNDPSLGIYKDDFSNTVCLFEEREPVDGKTYSTFKVLDKLEEDNDNLIDGYAVLKARMFDLLIGDWDRHEDQWRWQKTKSGKKNIYSPIPRDRDQVFFISTGIIPYVAGRSWVMPKFQGFDEQIKNVNGFMFNARHFDRRFLNELNQEDWKSVIKDIQLNISDSIIVEAVRQLPDTIYKQVGALIIHNLKSRRDVLLQEGLKYYRFLSKSIEVPVSDKKEVINITYQPNGNLNLLVQKKEKKNRIGDTIYYRTIDRQVTKEIRVFGRGGKDIFNLQGNEKSKIKVRLIGGGKDDEFKIGKYVDNKRSIYIYDRSDKGNYFPDKKQARLNLSSNNDINNYNGRTFKYNKLMPLVAGGYNLDDGLLIGGGAMYTKHGFRKDPYSSKHSIVLGGAFATGAGFLKYKGHMVDVIGSLDLDVQVNVRAPNNTANFFGIGNETDFLKISEDKIRYYRTRYHLSDIEGMFKYSFGKYANFFGGVTGQYYKLADAEDNIGRFIISYAASNPNEDVAKEKLFAGVKTGFDIDTRNSKIIPVRGMRWKTTITGVQQMGGQSRSFARLESEMSLLVSFSRSPKVVFANRFGLSTTLGDPYFFQINYIGGQGSLQGYRNNRFAGYATLYNNFEIRIKLFDFNSYLFPGRFGVIGFNDVGRVWARNDISDKWHVGYGGGLFVIPAQTIVLSGVLGFSEEGPLPYVSLGFRF
ncbi:MAG: BamA/TamA family outer membrane protein [Flavipsychrobacter sp.]